MPNSSDTLICKSATSWVQGPQKEGQKKTVESVQMLLEEDLTMHTFHPFHVVHLS